MPTYKYECDDCGYVFTKFQSMTEDPVRTCEKCGGKVKKLISPGGGVIFKGKGFYQTDYKGAAPSCNTGSDKPSPCESTGSCPCKE